MFFFCPKTANHSLSAVCRDMSGRHLLVELFKISFSFLLMGLIPANSDVVKTFYSLIYTNVTIPYLHALERWFTTYLELAEYNYEQFHCLDFDFGLVNFKVCLKILSGWPRFVQSHCK